jgi:hypothetical protein
MLQGFGHIALSERDQMRALNGELVFFQAKTPSKYDSSFWSHYRELEPGLQKNITGCVLLFDPSRGSCRRIPAASFDGIESWLASRIITSKGLAIRVFENDLQQFSDVLLQQKKVLAIIGY